MKWDQNNPEKVKDFIAKMKQDYAFKKAYAARRAWEFYNHPDVAGMCYVAVGGLDSITLFLFLRSIGIDVPGTSVSMLEDRSIQKVHKALGIRALRPANGPKDRPYTKIEVIREHGFPVLSKEIAKINSKTILVFTDSKDICINFVNMRFFIITIFVRHIFYNYICDMFFHSIRFKVYKDWLS